MHTPRPCLFREIVRAFEADAEPPSSGREARDVVAVIEAAYEAADGGARVELGDRLVAVQAV